MKHPCSTALSFAIGSVIPIAIFVALSVVPLTLARCPGQAVSASPSSEVEIVWKRDLWLPVPGQAELQFIEQREFKYVIRSGFMYSETELLGDEPYKNGQPLQINIAMFDDQFIVVSGRDQLTIPIVSKDDLGTIRAKSAAWQIAERHVFEAFGISVPTTVCDLDRPMKSLFEIHDALTDPSEEGSRINYRYVFDESNSIATLDGLVGVNGNKICEISSFNVEYSRYLGFHHPTVAENLFYSAEKGSSPIAKERIEIVYLGPPRFSKAEVEEFLHDGGYFQDSQIVPADYGMIGRTCHQFKDSIEPKSWRLLDVFWSTMFVVGCCVFSGLGFSIIKNGLKK